MTTDTDAACVFSGAQFRRRGELCQRRLGPRADMADDLGGAQAADRAAGRGAAGRGSGRRGSRRRKGRRRRSCRRRDRPARPRHRAPRCLAPWPSTTLPCSLRVSAATATWPRTAAAACVEIVGLVQRADLGLVGEQDIDLARHQLAERGAVAVDAERVGQAQRDLPSGAVRDPRRRCGTPPGPAADRTDSLRDR